MAPTAPDDVPIPNWVTFPGQDWQNISPAEAGIDPRGFATFLSGLNVAGADFGGEDHGGIRWGAVITRGGYLVHKWGDPHYRFQTASVGKAFARVLFGLAVEDGIVKPDDLISDTWTGEGQLSHRHKYLTEGHHRTLTWNHLLGPRDAAGHYGGFAIERGSEWVLDDPSQSPAPWVRPAWVKWTRDPFYDCYAHIAPGTVLHYSSGGYWRLGQALTALWRRDLKDVLDERVFSRIGIPANRWNWPTGEWIKHQKYLYPGLPESYTYLDPPYEIDGVPIRSCPGWAVVSASDLARFGFLVATRGVWDGERLIGTEWIRGHGGGNKSGSSGESEHFTSMGVVTTAGLDHSHSIAEESFLPRELFVGPVNV